MTFWSVKYPTFRYVCKWVQLSGEPLRIMWLSCGLKLASPDLGWGSPRLLTFCDHFFRNVRICQSALCQLYRMWGMCLAWVLNIQVLSFEYTSASQLFHWTDWGERRGVSISRPIFQPRFQPLNYRIYSTLPLYCNIAYRGHQPVVQTSKRFVCWALFDVRKVWTQ